MLILWTVIVPEFTFNVPTPSPTTGTGKVPIVTPGPNSGVSPTPSPASKSYYHGYIETFHWNSGTKTLIRSNMIIAVLLYLIRKSCLVDHFCCLLFLSINGKFHNYSHKWSNSHLRAISAIMSQNADGYVTFVLPIVFSA